MHSRLGVDDSVRLNRKLPRELLSIVELLEKCQSVAGTVLVPDPLSPTPPCREAGIHLNPVTRPMHDLASFNGKHGPARLEVPVGKDILSELDWPNKLSFNHAF